ncbi:Plant UBX domain-containing protein 10 [Hirschfeldia incana]|nr:Plant UBX domain-containing protein 10 [Hirschfeldia incana]
MVDVADKLGYFQAITGLEDPDLCTEILQAHGWDLELAISSFTSSSSDPRDNNNDADHHPSPSGVDADQQNREPFTDFEDDPIVNDDGGRAFRPPGIAWKIITLPVSIVSGSLGLASTAIGFGFWVAGGALTYSLGMLGFGSGRRGGSESSSSGSVSSSAAGEAMEFISSFDRDYGSNNPLKPGFVSEGFMDALQRSRSEFKLLFVYLHSPDHPDTQPFCEGTLCDERVVAFLNENFVAWGGSIRSSEGFKMSNSLKASRFPFCAVVMPAANQRITLLQQVEGPTSPEEMIAILQRVVEDSSTVLVTARVEAEERRNNLRLREEQDAAYRAALEADQARERQRQEEQERIEREAAEAERKRKEEEEAREREEREAAEREAARVRMRQEKALALGDEPEKGPDVTQVLVRFPNGERKGRRFESNTKIQTLYDYVDSLGVLETEEYSLITNFPRTVYGRDKESMSLKDAGLHPQASLFIEIN